MVRTICLITCALATAQPAGGPEWSLRPTLSRGQELVYRGAYTEEALAKGVQFNRSYRLEARAFVLDVRPEGAQVAFFTAFKIRPATVGGVPGEPVSVRLEVARIDPQGKVSFPSGATPAVPLEGPPTLEWGAFVESPRARVRQDQSWEVAEEGRPPRTWQV